MNANGDLTDVKVPYDGQSTDNDNGLSNGQNSEVESVIAGEQTEEQTEFQELYQKLQDLFKDLPKDMFVNRVLLNEASHLRLCS